MPTSIHERGIAIDPPPAFAARAGLGTAGLAAMAADAADDLEMFWAAVAQRSLRWSRRWDRVLDWRPPHAHWFPGSRLNASVNCLDRHLEGPLRHKRAIVWEGEPGDTRTLTYAELSTEVAQAGNALRALGVRPGDVVAVYMPLVPEAIVAMIACARIGAPHDVVFGGFGPEALQQRLNDVGARVLITADGGLRKGREVPLKANADKALAGAPSVRRCLVVERVGTDPPMAAGRDLAWDLAVEEAEPECAPFVAPSDHPLFVLHTSGTTGRPKGIVHGTAGYMVHAHASTRWIFDLKPEDVYWCTADIGWITGHTYLVYGPLSNGATVLLYEGAPMHPGPDRWWSLIERHKATILYTAPTAIRAAMRHGPGPPSAHDLSSLRLLGTVGEPIDPETWRWYSAQIGLDRCPIVDTWWQTETGGAVLATVPGAQASKPASAGPPLPGLFAAIVDEKGRHLPDGEEGRLVLTRPWPGMMLTIHGDDERYGKAYWDPVPGAFFTGDAAWRDADGYYWITGRVDDVIKVAGHRLGTAELEAALVSHGDVAEAAVVARSDPVKGSAIVAFVTLRRPASPSPALAKSLQEHVAATVGPIARPSEVRFAEGLPKTRSGKVMRRLLRDLAAGRAPAGDTTTLEDREVLDRLVASAQGP